MSDQNKDQIEEYLRSIDSWPAKFLGRSSGDFWFLYEREDNGNLLLIETSRHGMDSIGQFIALSWEDVDDLRVLFNQADPGRG